MPATATFPRRAKGAADGAVGSVRRDRANIARPCARVLAALVTSG